MIEANLLDQFARVALSHVTRQYPNKLDHVMLTDDDVQTPQSLHPIFYGSFDWHSCVHGYWTLATVLRLRPEGPFSADIRALFDHSFTTEKVTIEAAYAAKPSSRGFERPYGWAWALMLTAELSRHDATWFETFKPLNDVFVRRSLDYLTLATYPIRTGVHSSTAFAARLSLEYAKTVGDTALFEAWSERLMAWHRDDQDAKAWEPSNDDFLSPTLAVAQALVISKGAAIAAWLDGYLPNLKDESPKSLFTPAVPADRTDGKMSHLDGLNLSRAFAFFEISASLPNNARAKVLACAETHLKVGLAQVEGDYMGEHWLASFALLALLAREATSAA